MLNKKLHFFNELKKKPTKIFLFDGLGACLTGILLFSISCLKLNFGIPSKSICILACYAFFLCIISSVFYLFVKSKWKFHLKTILVSNTIYCLLTIVLLSSHSEEITLFGFTYFLIELVIIGLFIKIEYHLLF